MRACRACHKWFDGYAPWDFGAVQSGHMWDISHQNLSMACLKPASIVVRLIVLSRIRTPNKVQYL